MNWQKVDAELSKYLKEYKKKQLMLQDRIQNIFDLDIKDINVYVNSTNLKRFKRYLEENKELVKDNDYVLYMLNKYIKKTRISYKELLKVMLLVEYAVFEDDIKENQYDTFKNIGENVMEDAIGSCKKLGLVPKKKLPLLDSLLLAYLMTSNNTGMTYQEQNNGNAIYGAEEVYKQAVVDIMQNKKPDVNDKSYQDIFDKQQRREINKKKDSKQVDKYSGMLDVESTFLINQEQQQVYDYYGVEYCQFKAVEDNKTTKMCESLNGQIFSLNEMNIYQRYSKEDDRYIIYHSKGMVLGENLPPINNGFHYCRSWTEPYIK